MESYIIRIYRREKDSNSLLGTVEEVGVDDKRSFSNMKEIWNILTSPGGRAAGRGKPGPGKTPPDKDKTRGER